MIKGNIHAGKLQVEPTATFNGECHMNMAPALAEKQEEKKADAKFSDKTNAVIAE